MIRPFHDPPAEVRAALAGKRVLVIEFLTWVILPIALLMAALGSQVVYIYPQGQLAEPKWIDRLKRFGIRMNEFAELPGFNLYGRLVVAEDCAELIVSNEAAPPLLGAVESLFPEIPDRSAKIKLLLFDAIYSPLWDIGNSLALACYYTEAGAKVRVGLPVKRETVLLHSAGVLPATPVFPVIFQLAALGLQTFVRRLGRIFAKRLVQVPPASENDHFAVPAKLEASVLFFPHKGVMYGELYEKTQFYVDEPAHPLSRQNILHVELVDFMSPAERTRIVSDYEQRGYRYVSLRQIFGGLDRRAVIAAARRLNSWTLNRLLMLGVAAILARRVEAWLRGLSDFPTAKLALIHFEFIVPRALKYALQARGVRVVAMQERHIAVSRKSQSLILDGYLVQSERCREWAMQNPFSVIGKIEVVGDHHASRLSRLRAARPVSPQPIVACYDFHSIDDPIENAQLAFNNWKSNRTFYEAILAASRRFPSARFVIHGKDTLWMGLPFFRSVAEEISKASNIEVIEHRELDSGYRLAASADCVFARYNSLVDQALAAAIPALIHEEMWRDHRCVAWWRDYDGHPVFTRSRDELISRLEDVLERKQYMPGDEFGMLRRSYYDLHPETVAARTRAAIEAWLGMANLVPAHKGEARIV